MNKPVFEEHFIAVIEEAKIMMSVLATRLASPVASVDDEVEYSAIQKSLTRLDELEVLAQEHIETLQRQLQESVNRIDLLAVGEDLPLSDTQRCLSAAELGQALGLSEEEVYRLESDGQLFSIKRSSIQVDREYPAFQAWNGIAGTPLKVVLSTLSQCGATGSSQAFIFFTGATDLLGYLTPIEALSARLTKRRTLDLAAQALLQQSASDRLEAVVNCARAHAASASGW